MKVSRKAIKIIRKKEKQYKYNHQIANRKTNQEYQQLCSRIKNLTEAYILYKKPLQFKLLEHCCKQRDQLINL